MIGTLIVASHFAVAAGWVGLTVASWNAGDRCRAYWWGTFAVLWFGLGTLWSYVATEQAVVTSQLERTERELARTEEMLARTKR